MLLPLPLPLGVGVVAGADAVLLPPGSPGSLVSLHSLEVHSTKIFSKVFYTFRLRLAWTCLLSLLVTVGFFLKLLRKEDFCRFNIGL